MNRFLFLVALIALQWVPVSADACNRCGLFGRHCRYSYTPTYYKPVVYTPPVQNQTQNFVFNNSFPTPYLLAPQGNSVYGYSLAAQSYQQDTSLYMDRAGRYTELALQQSVKAQEGYTANVSSALAYADASDRRQKDTLLALTAIHANAQPVSPQAFRATYSQGKLSVEKIESPQPGQPLPQVSIIACGRCHDGKQGPNKPPVTSILDGSVAITQDYALKCIERIHDGSMPPPDQAGQPALSEQERNLVILQLGKIVQ